MSAQHLIVLAYAALPLSAHGADAPPAADARLDEEFSVLGAIQGNNDPSFRDTVLLLDVVTGKTAALVVGQCLPRVPEACITAIHERTIDVDAAGRSVLIATIDGAVPKATTDGDPLRIFVP